LPFGNTSFRSIVVKPYLVAEDNKDAPDPESPLAPAPVPAPTKQPEEMPKRKRGRPRKTTSLIVDFEALLQSDEEQFSESRHLELIRLLAKDVFKVIKASKVPEGVRIFNSRFVDEIKLKNDILFIKSRLVVQAYNDDKKKLVLTQSPTIQRISQRIILCIAAIGTATKQPTDLYLRDISQAYVQSTTSLNRDFFIKPPRELAAYLNLQDGAVLKVVKPLYGVPKAGNHWFKTYHSHHINEMSIEQSTYDPCLLYNTNPFGVVGLQTNDTLFVADAEFADLEQTHLQKA
jgi:hypothetical protein